MTASPVTAKSAVFDRLGGVEVMDVRDTVIPPPGPGELRVRVTAIGLNRSEGYYRQGVYIEVYNMQIEFPSRLGYEAAGVVESVGAGVTGFAVGDRVSTLPVIELNSYGTYGELFNVPAKYVVHSPSEISEEEVAALWSSYLTAYGMIVDLANIQPGDWVLATAASSSLGPPIFQMVEMLGGKVIATTRTRAKAEVVRQMGAEHVIVTDEEDMIARVNEITGGKGVAYAFDPIGGPILDTVVQTIAPHGTLVLYGIMDFDAVDMPVRHLVSRNLTVSGYAMLLEDRPERDKEAIAFIRKGVKDGKLKPLVGKVFPLDQIKEAVTYLESLQHVGKVVVLPDAAK